MDKLANRTIDALQWVIDCAEGVTCSITQDLEKEELIIVNEFGQKTVMNCKFNSVGATIRQICKHINAKTLFSYEEDYTIGC